MRTDQEKDEMICGDPIEMYRVLELTEKNLAVMEKAFRVASGLLLVTRGNPDTDPQSLMDILLKAAEEHL
jgi:hypothetical protein